jgi:allantoinase
MADYETIIRGGAVVTPNGITRADIAIAGGKIRQIAANLKATSAEQIDATGLHIFPGLIDAHVHFNEPGRTEWEGFATGSSALAAGGGTCFIEMPLNALPPTLDGESFDAKRRAAEKSSHTDFALWGGLTPINLDKLPELAARGVIGFKAFMSGSGIDDFPRADDHTLEQGMKTAAALGLPVAVHAEDEDLTSRLTTKARSAGLTSVRDYLASRPIAAELDAINRAMNLAAQTGCSLHIVHVSSAKGGALIAKNKSRLSVTSETCPHYLVLSDNDLERLGAAAKCAPPLRSREESAALWQQILAGDFDFVASDHSPAPASMKQSPDFFAIWGGISGVQSTLNLLLSIEPHMPLEQVARLSSHNVAARFNLPNKGQIIHGFDADLALIDLNATFTLRREDLLDRHKFSPYVGRTMRGIVRRTIVRGQTIFENGKILSPAQGRLITPARSTRTDHAPS